MESEFIFLKEKDVHKLRVERTILLEAELCRAQLQLEEARSPEEVTAVRADIANFRARLEVHYTALGAIAPEHDEDPGGRE